MRCLVAATLPGCALTAVAPPYLAPLVLHDSDAIVDMHSDALWQIDWSRRHDYIAVPE